MDFLLAWEMGGGYGHVAPLAQIARPLVDAGHRVHFALKDLSAAPVGLDELFGHPRVSVWQAPLWLPPYAQASHPLSYPELLFAAGYLDARRLSGVVGAWRSLFRQIRPDLLLVDHAPTALLAARGCGFRRVNAGNGFVVPPREVPVPAFAEWALADAGRLASSEKLVLDTCNSVLHAFGAAPMNAFHELFDTDENFILSWPETDHYWGLSRRDGDCYWGAIAPAALGPAPIWPAGEGRRLFAYLKPEYAPSMQVLSELSRGPWRASVCIPGLSTAAAAAHESPSLHVATQPVDVIEVARSAELLLCHGNAGTCGHLLLAGLPMLLLPMHAEQLLHSRRLQQLGAAIVLTEDRAAADLAPALHRLDEEPAFRRSAQSFAGRYGPGGPLHCGDVAGRVARRCMALASHSSGGSGRGVDVATWSPSGLAA